MNQIRTLRADEIECRIGTFKEGKGMTLLLYKDARCDMAILDETFGPLNWQRHHSRDNANCVVSVWDDEKKQWIDKEDTGTESNTEAEKGLASDSFKRACVNVGIGRELYTAPFIWLTPDKYNDKYDRFVVTSIGYNDRREINQLTIKNLKTRQTVFSFQEGMDTPETENAHTAQNDAPQRAKQSPKSIEFVCNKCGKQLVPYLDKNGKEIGIRQHAAGSENKFGQVLCLDCIHELYPDTLNFAK